MPNFDIVKDINPPETYRVASVLGAFDLQIEHVKEHFKGDIQIEDKSWNVGLIVGASGTGKSTIAKEVFGEYYHNGYNYDQASVIDDMPKDKSIKEIQHTFTRVGFASPPSWLKPYSVLSNGERMRVDLARCILQEKEVVVFDEFTSVVDRNVAQTSSLAISKAVKKMDKQFIAVSCHKDIIDWLEPDWIYDTDKQEFFFAKANTKDPTSKSKYTNPEGKTGIEFGICLSVITI